ncbi:MAG TPA: GNVR domain-containing protein [Candidatus Angelobacter sp.]
MESRRPVIAPPYEPEFAPRLDREQQRGIAGKLALWWRHRGFLWRVLWITALLSTAVAFLIPRRFKSTAKLVAPDGSNVTALSGILNKASGGGSGALGLDPSTLLGLKTPGAFYIAVLESRTVQDHLVEKFDLRTHYGKKYYQDARKKLYSNTDIEEDKKSAVITLSVTDWDAAFAAALVRSYIVELNRVAADLNTSAAHREREFLEQRLQSAKQDLDLASMQLSEFSSKHTMMDVQQQSRTMMDAASRLQGELIASQSELKGLEQIYSVDNVRVRSLRARIGELQSQLNKMVGAYTTPDAVDDTPAGSYPSIRTLPALGYRYQELYRQAKTQETIFEFLTQQYELARVEEAKELPVVRVMDPPNVPEKKNSPIRSLIVALSVFLALVLGCWWVVEKEKWDQLAPDDSRRMLVAEVASDLKNAMRRIRSGRTESGA